MIDISLITGDINGALYLAKWSGAICLFLAVISGLHFAATNGHLRLVVRIDLHRLGAGARIPNSWIAPAQTHRLVCGGIGYCVRRAVTVQLVELGFARGVHFL